MDIVKAIVNSNINEVSETIKEAARKGVFTDAELRIESHDIIPTGYYDFELDNIEFKGCFIYPMANNMYKGLLDSVKVKEVA